MNNPGNLLFYIEGTCLQEVQKSTLKEKNKKREDPAPGCRME